MSLEILHSTLGFAVQLATLVAGLVTFLIGVHKKFRASAHPPHRAWFAAGASLMVVAATALLLRVAFPKPILAISAPLGTVDVQEPEASSGSVRFSVSGTSTSVPVDLCVYVLVKVASEWHVQDCVEAQPEGEWFLSQAWIGDASAPVVDGTTLYLMAVVAHPGIEKDRKVSHPYQLSPVAVSKQMRVTVQSVQPYSRQARAK